MISVEENNINIDLHSLAYALNQLGGEIFIPHEYFANLKDRFIIQYERDIMRDGVVVRVKWR